MNGMMTNRAWMLALLALVMAAPMAQAQTRDDMFKDKPFTIVVGHEPGTGFDLYARTLARYLPRYLPGKPNALVQNVVGASGVSAFNWLGSVAPKDGGTIAIVAFTVPFAPILGHAAGRFDASQYNWIGNMDSSVSVCAFSKASGALTFEHARQREVMVGGTGASGPLSQSATALRALTGPGFGRTLGYSLQTGNVAGLLGVLVRARPALLVRTCPILPTCHDGRLLALRLDGLVVVCHARQSNPDSRTAGQGRW